MTKYSYVAVITGEAEAPSEENARAQVAMGISISGRLMATPLQLAIQVTEAGVGKPLLPTMDGQKPKKSAFEQSAPREPRSRLVHKSPARAKR